jgi:hypothetical protein
VRAAAFLGRAVLALGLALTRPRPELSPAPARRDGGWAA